MLDLLIHVSGARICVCVQFSQYLHENASYLRPLEEDLLQLHHSITEDAITALVREHMHTYTRAHIHTHSHTHKLSHSHSHAHTHTHTHVLSLTHTHTHARAHTRTHTHTLTHMHAHTHTHTHVLSLTHTLSLTHARTHTHTLAHTHTHTNTYTCTHRHAHTHARTHSLTTTHARTYKHTHTLSRTHTLSHTQSLCVCRRRWSSCRTSPDPSPPTAASCRRSCPTSSRGAGSRFSSVCFTHRQDRYHLCIETTQCRLLLKTSPVTSSPSLEVSSAKITLRAMALIKKHLTLFVVM